MIDIRKLFPIVKQSLPNAPDDLLLKKMQEFSQQHPEMDNVQALMALNEAMKDPVMQQFVAKGKAKFSDIEARLDQKEVK